jgi:serine O-acetyltransferase
MLQKSEKLAICDPVWSRLRAEAEAIVEREPALASFVETTVLAHARFETALAVRLAQKLGGADMNAMAIRQIMDQAHSASGEMAEAARADIVAVYDRDPACSRYIEPFLFFKGFLALQSYRIGHWLWSNGRKDLALFLQNRISEQFQVDIHPAAKIGRGIMMDHATGIVIGETAVVEDGVSMLHGVTLGGTGKEQGDRHPKIRRGVLIAAGAKVLGNIEVGRCAKIAAGSVVLHAVPPCATVAGVPARIVSITEGCAPASEMDQTFDEGATL